ncbi:MAG: RNA methyltransferase [Bacillota bacterium]
MDRITSTQNRRIKGIRKLFRRRIRRITGLCLVEGIHPVLQALDSRTPVETVVVCPEQLESEVGIRAAEQAEERGIEVLPVSADVFSSISSRDNPVGMAAVARPRYSTVDEIQLTEEAVLTVLLEIGNPGNLGTIVRTIDATGGSGAVLVGQTTDPFDPTAIRASMGTVFSVPLVRIDSMEDLLRNLRTRGVGLVTTSARAETDLARARFPRPCAVLLGSENAGIPGELLREGDLQVRIPMRGRASSLNLAVAAGIILYEATKCRDGE